MLFVFPRLSIDVEQVCSKFASCHFAQAKAALKVSLTENRTAGVIPKSRLWGGTPLFCPRPPYTLFTPLTETSLLSLT